MLLILHDFHKIIFKNYFPFSHDFHKILFEKAGLTSAVYKQREGFFPKMFNAEYWLHHCLIWAALINWQNPEGF